jgi:putative transposase
MSAPPGFKPFDVHAPIKVYRRRLPHWRQEGATYFVTIHTNDSLPKTALEDLQWLRVSWMKEHPEPHATEELKQLSQILAARTDQWLDQAYGSTLFRDLKCRTILYNALLHFHGTSITLGAFVVMPNHVHAVVRPIGDTTLENWVGSIKQYTTGQLNKHLSQQGSLWFRENFDRIIRDVGHLQNCVQYIGRNPQKAGLPSTSSHQRWINPSWQTAGWKFP